jgi:hypothetical protein
MGEAPEKRFYIEAGDPAVNAGSLTLVAAMII